MSVTAAVENYNKSINKQCKRQLLEWSGTTSEKRRVDTLRTKWLIYNLNNKNICIIISIGGPRNSFWIINLTNILILKML